MDFQHALQIPAPQETAQVAFDGARYYRTDSGIYLKDFGNGSSDDSALLYSGQMLDFDGVDDYVDTHCELVDGDSYTVIATINSSSFANSQGVCSTYFGGNGLILDTGSRLSFTVRGSVSNVSLLSSALSTDTFYRAVCIANSEGSVYLYINGELVASGSMGSGNTINRLTGHPFRLGAYTPTTDYYMNGFIGNVQVWDAAFDADDVEFDYNHCFLGDVTAADRPGTSLTSANLKGWWKLIEGKHTNGLVYDWSDNNLGVSMENFGSTTPWTNADQLTDPSVIQTALTEWGMGYNLFKETQLVGGTTLSRLEAGTNQDSCRTPIQLYEIIPDDTYGGHGVAYSALDGIVENTEFWLKLIAKKGDEGRNFHATATWYDNSFNSYTAFTTRVDLDTGTVLDASNCTTTVEVLDSVNKEYLILIKNTSVADAFLFSGNFYIEGPSGNLLYTGDGETVVALLGGFSYASEDVPFVPTDDVCVPSNGRLVKAQSYETAGQFKLDYSGMNWNGRSYAVIGNGSDIKPDGKYAVVEVVARTDRHLSSDSKMVFGNSGYGLRIYSEVSGVGNYMRWYAYYNGGATFFSKYCTDPNPGGLAHFVFTYNGETQEAKAFYNGVEDTTHEYYFPTDASYDYNLAIDTANLNFGATPTTYFQYGQLSYFRVLADADAQAIIDGGLAAWVTKRYNKAATKYGL